MTRYAIYCPLQDHIPTERMSALADELCEFNVDQTDGVDSCYTYRWPDQTLVIHVMPQAEISHHLDGFVGYVHWLCGNRGIEPNMDLIARIRDTKLVLGCVLSPDPTGEDESTDDEEENPVDALISSIIHDTKSLLFCGDAIYDERLNLIIRPADG